MPIYKGTQEITKIYKGTQEITSVYKGSQAVFTSSRFERVDYAYNNNPMSDLILFTEQFSTSKDEYVIKVEIDTLIDETIYVFKTNPPRIIFSYERGGYFSVKYGTGINTNFNCIDFGSIDEYKINKNGFYKNGNLLGGIDYMSYTQNANFCINLPRTNNYKFYELKKYSDSVLVHHFVPVYDKKYKKYGLYDLITNNYMEVSNLIGGNVLPKGYLLGKYVSRTSSNEDFTFNFNKPNIVQMKFRIKMIKDNSASILPLVFRFGIDNEFMLKQYMLYYGGSNQFDNALFAGDNPSLYEISNDNFYKNKEFIQTLTRGSKDISGQSGGIVIHNKVKFYYADVYDDDNASLIAKLYPAYNQSTNQWGVYNLTTNEFLGSNKIRGELFRPEEIVEP